MNQETTDKRIVYAETRKVDNNETRNVFFRKLTSIRYVTGTRYLENILKLQVCRSSVVNK